MRYLKPKALACLLSIVGLPACAQLADSLSPVPRITFLSSTGVPLAGGCVFTYQSGTSRPAETYTDQTGTIENSNPVILDSAGSAIIFLDNTKTYRFRVATSGGTSCATGSQVSETDGVSAVNMNSLLGSNNTWTGNNTFNGSLTVSATESHSGVAAFTGNFTLAGGQHALSAYRLDNIVFVDGNKYPCSDVGINAAIAALPAGGGTVDARGCKGRVTLASTVTVGVTSKAPITIFTDRSTTFYCTITNNTPCFVVLGNATLMGFGTQSNGATGLIVPASAVVSDGLLIQGNQTTNQVGSFVEGLTVQAASGATIKDALCAVQNTLQSTKLLNVTCTSAASNTVGLKIYSTGGANGIANPLFDNITVDTQGVSGSHPVWIGCAASGTLTASACSSPLQSIDFVGGVAVHPGTGLPIITIESSNGAGGTNTLQNINFFGIQIESSHAADIGILDDGAAAVGIANLFASCAAGVCGTSVVKLAQPAGTTLDGFLATTVTQSGPWRNTFENTVFVDAVTGSQCSNGCAYRYTKNGASSVSSYIFSDLNGRELQLDSSGLTLGYQTNNVSLLASKTAPTISSGFGTSASIANNNGTASFTINVGRGGTATSGVIGFPRAAHGWDVNCKDITTTSSAVFLTKQTASSITTATIGNFNTSAAAAAWNASDILSCTATAY